MPKAIKPQVNGAAIDEKLTEKIVATGITASELAMVTQAGGPLKLLALVSFLISRMMLDVGGKTLAIQELLTQHGAALTKAADQSTKPGDFCKAVLPEINAAIAKLEQVCSDQLAFWKDISRRAGTVALLVEILTEEVEKLA
jgi:hypothetical protein